MSDFVVGQRPLLEVADVIRSHGEAFLQKHGGHLTATQKKALRDLAQCRTAALGGHVERCLDCGHERPAYNSCRNRHCPKCQALSRARWLMLSSTTSPIVKNKIQSRAIAARTAIARVHSACYTAFRCANLGTSPSSIAGLASEYAPSTISMTRVAVEA